MSLDLGNYSQMQQYYISKQLPQFSTVKEVPKQKKDHNYYNDNFNIWNNRAQTANKNYAFYHQQVDEGKHIVEKMKDREILDKLILEEQKKQYIMMQKQIDQERLQQRKRERFALQLESMQDIINKDPKEINSFLEMTSGTTFHQSQSANNLVNNKSSSKQNQNPLLGRPPHQWNKLNQTSKKYIGQAINAKIIQKDEEAVYSITKRIEQDQEIENLKKQSLDKIYQQTRASFLKSHQKNVEFEMKCGLLPQEKPIVLIQSKLNKSTIIPLKKKLSSRNIAQGYSIQAQENNNQYQQQIDNDDYRRYSSAISQQNMENQEDEYEGQGNINSARQEYMDSQRKNLESSSQNQRKGKSIQGILQKNTNNIHQQLQYSSLPYNENETDEQHDQEEDIKILYNNKNNQQTKQQLNQINFGDEKGFSSLQNKNRRKSSFAKQNETVQHQQQQEHPPILKQNVQNMTVNTKSQRGHSFHGQYHSAGGAEINNNNNNNLGNNYLMDREFLTSAESHAKKQVNFQPKQQQQQQTTHSSSHNQLKSIVDTTSFVQKNMDDVKPPQGQVKFRKIDGLAQPKQDYQPKDYMERSEYKGLLSTELNGVNINSDTEFARTMMMNSQIVNSKIYNSQRPSTRQSKISRITQTNSNTFSFVRPSTTASGTRSIIFKNPQNISSNNEINEFQAPPLSSTSPMNNLSNTSNKIHSLKNIHKMNAESTLNIDQKNELLSEIDNFEKKYQFVKENRVGFSKCNLMKFQQKETFMSAKSALGQK